MRPSRTLLVALALGATLGARHVVEHAPPERVAINRNERPAGTLRDGVLTLHLVARVGRWYPEAEDGLSVDVPAFGEAGRAPEVPGPLVRVPAGTEVRVTVRNALDSALVLRGFHDRPSGARDTLQVAAGATREIRFRLDAPGTYGYTGRSTADSAVRTEERVDAVLSGAIVVDPADAAPARERVFVIQTWSRSDAAAAPRETWGQALVINGKAWPHTERLTFDVGDTVRWRVVNPSSRPHPLHLHGFYFRVDSRGTLAGDTIYAPAQQRMAVTELAIPRSTMSLTWVAERPGNWVFHCHFAAHVSHDARLHAAGDDGSAPAADASHDGHGAARPHAMSGLVLGLHVRDPFEPHAPTVAASATAARALRLLVFRRPDADSARPAFGYALQGGGAEPTAGARGTPGPELVLTRGQPVRITVVNRMREPTAVHWHGIELESFPDGVPGWSGSPGRLMPPIAPGDSFVAAFTPPRAGTFMYHAHMDEGRQIGGGLYAPLLVLEPGRARDPTTDHVLLFSQDGSAEGTGEESLSERLRPMLVNGRLAPDTLDLRADVAHRLRLVFIRANGAARLRLRGAAPTDTALASWRPLAKDGADLPAARRQPRPAALAMSTGETQDVELTLAPGAYVLEAAYPAVRPMRVVRIPVRVR